MREDPPLVWDGWCHATHTTDCETLYRGLGGGRLLFNWLPLGVDLEMDEAGKVAPSILPPKTLRNRTHYEWKPLMQSDPLCQRFFDQAWPILMERVERAKEWAAQKPGKRGVPHYHYRHRDNDDTHVG